ncbi:hypothetical protein ACERIT_03685 [Halopenitus sp. H-Gu1]|uniref:hypothetical protein n=1 Tax=Halopenitus sp. H-Gu1 TaxID=3242697 RepID=UPI00359D3F6C
MYDPTSLIATAPIQMGIAATPLGRLLIGLVAVAAVIIIGRVVLAVAWKLVTIAAVIVALLFLLSSGGII